MSESFREFYLKRHPDMRQIFQVIEEMSVRTSENRDLLNNNDENLYITQYVVKKGEHIDNYVYNHNDLEVYKYDPFQMESEEIKLWFVVNKQITVAKVDFFVNGSAIIINDANARNRGFERIMQHIYTDYFLRKYKQIISDNSHTDNGFYFYRNMLEDKERLGIVMTVLNYETKQEIPLNDASELINYFGEKSEFLKYRFVIRKK